MIQLILSIIMVLIVPIHGYAKCINTVSYTLKGYLEDGNNLPVPGLMCTEPCSQVVLFDVLYDDGTSLLNQEATAEMGQGWYRYTYTANGKNGVWIMRHGTLVYRNFPGGILENLCDSQVANYDSVGAVTIQDGTGAGQIDTNAGAVVSVTTAGSVTNDVGITQVGADKVWSASATVSGTSPAIDAVWNEAQSGHTTAGTFGKYLDSEVSAAGGADPALMQSTTIATLTTQTSFTLTAGSADNDAYNGAIIVITDATTGTQKAVGRVLDYTGATKTVTLNEDPAVFVMAATDIVDIIATDKTYSTIATNLDTTVGSRMATYTQPTGFLAATFPTTVASPTNITAGTIATVTNAITLPAIPTDWITAAGILAGAITVSEAPNLDATVSSRSTFNATTDAVDLDFTLACPVTPTAGTVGDACKTSADSTAQTGDVYPLASTEIADIKAKTDLIPADPADASDIAALLSPIQADTNDLQSRTPAALIGGKMDSDTTAISGDTAAADNLESEHDGTGYMGSGIAVSPTTDADTSGNLWRTIEITETGIITANDDHIGKYLWCGKEFSEIMKTVQGVTDTITVDPAEPFGTAQTSGTCYIK